MRHHLEFRMASLSLMFHLLSLPSTFFFFPFKYEDSSHLSGKLRHPLCSPVQAAGLSRHPLLVPLAASVPALTGSTLREVPASSGRHRLCFADRAHQRDCFVQKLHFRFVGITMIYVDDT